MNLAARMSAAAAGGEVLIDTSTMERLGASHTVEPIGATPLEGIPTAVPLFRLTVDTAKGPP